MGSVPCLGLARLGRGSKDLRFGPNAGDAPCYRLAHICASNVGILPTLAPPASSAFRSFLAACSSASSAVKCFPATDTTSGRSGLYIMWISRKMRFRAGPATGATREWLMPIFEYVCNDCRKRFEALVYGSKEPECPLCHGTNLEQQISVFSVGASRGSAAMSEPPCGNTSCAMRGGPGCCPNVG